MLPLGLVLRSVLLNIFITDLDNRTEGSLSNAAKDEELTIMLTRQIIVLPFNGTSTGYRNGLTGTHQSSTKSWEGLTPCARQGWRLTSVAEKDLCPCTKDNQKPQALGRGLQKLKGEDPSPFLSSREIHLECCPQLWASYLKGDTEAKPGKLNGDDYGTGASNVRQETERARCQNKLYIIN